MKGNAVSLIVATLNRSIELDRFLDSLDAQTCKEFEVIIVDQNSDNRVVDIIKRHASLRLVHLRSDPGLSRSRNLGLKAAAGSIYAVPDDDCWYPPDLVASVKTWFENHPEFDVLLTSVRDEHNTLQGPRRRSRIAFECDKHSVWNNAISISTFWRKSLSDSVGLFDERLGIGADTIFQSGEETDYLLRAMAANHRTWFEASISVFHPSLREPARARKQAYPFAVGTGHVLAKHRWPPYRLLKDFVLRAFGGALVAIYKQDIMTAKTRILRGMGIVRGYFASENSAPDGESVRPDPKTVPCSEKRIGINLLCYNGKNLFGSWTFIRRLIEELPPLEGVECVFLCQRSFELEKHIRIPEGIRFKRVDSLVCRSRVGRILYEQLILPLKGRGLDVLFSPYVGNPVVHPGFRTVTTIHDLIPSFVPSRYPLVQRAYVRLITRLLALTSDRIVTVSQHSKSDLINYLRIDARKVDVIYNFVQPHEPSEIKYENYFLSVGTLQPGKNLIGVVRSFAKFAHDYDCSQHRLLIIGAQDRAHRPVQDYIREIGMESRILLTGYIGDTELGQLYSKCKGVILLSLYEGFGIPPLEALSWKKPSVVSNRSSLPEVVGTTGIRVDPTDHERAALAIRAIAEDPARYLEGREEQLLRFSPAVQVQRFLTTLGLREKPALAEKLRFAEQIGSDD